MLTLEASDSEPKGQVEAIKKRSSAKEDPGSNTSCKRGGKSGCTKKHPQESRKNYQPPTKEAEERVV